MRPRTKLGRTRREAQQRAIRDIRRHLDPRDQFDVDNNGRLVDAFEHRARSTYETRCRAQVAREIAALLERKDR